jgi:hypothetical protein
MKNINVSKWSKDQRSTSLRIALLRVGKANAGLWTITAKKQLTIKKRADKIEACIIYSYSKGRQYEAHEQEGVEDQVDGGTAQSNHRAYGKDRQRKD